MALYKAKTALYSDKDPYGPDAGNATISTEPVNGFQICGEGGTVDGELAERLGLVVGGHVVEFDAEAEKAANDAKNRATYGSAAAGGRVANVAPAPEPVKAASEPAPVKGADSKEDAKPAKAKR